MLASAVIMLALAMQPPTVDTPRPDAAPQTQAPEQAQAPAQKTASTDDQEHKAKEPPTPEHTGIKALLANVGTDITKLPALPNVYIAAVGGLGALAVHPVDQTFNEHLQSSGSGGEWWAPGKYLGDTPEQVAMSLGTYAVGRIFDQPKTAHLGMDLLQAQILTEIIVEPIKFATHRERPDGSNHQSFPSGHAAITFAGATVIERHLGWKYSVIGYGIASYVAASRLHDNRHYLSDVVFGAAVGTISGRTVVHHASDYWAVAPVRVPGGVMLMVSRTKP